MICAECGTVSRAGQKFCMACGCDLSPASPALCRRCGFLNDAAANYCGGCGLALRSSIEEPGNREPPGLASETASGRRQVTALFCDLVDSTGLATALDPEDYRAVLGAYQQACAAAIVDFGGYVAQYLGDGVLAYFGYPWMHADDARRAVCAGLRAVGAVSAMHPGHGLLLRTRVGIATGTVIISAGEGQAGPDDVAIIGDAPHLAARLQGVARPNSVAISALTRSVLGPDFSCASLGRHRLRGFSQPIEVWQVTGDPPVPQHLRSLRSTPLRPLVGRSSEHAVLTRCTSRLREGAGQIVLIRGEAGVGKSRLVQDIVRPLADCGAVLVIELACSPWHIESAYYPLIQCLNQLFFAGCRPSDVADAWSGIQRLLGALAVDDPIAVSPVFAQLLALPFNSTDSGMIPLTPERQQRLIQQSLLSVLLRRAEGKPLILVIEDLQWADPSTLDFVNFLVGQANSQPVLGLLTGSAEFSPAWFLHRSVALVALDRLDESQAAELAALVAAPQVLDPAVTALLIEHSRGLPLYVEEFTRATVDTGTDSATGSDLAAVPGSLQQAIANRLSRLGDAERVARIAAVLGCEFSLPILSALWPDSPDALAGGMAGLLREGFIEHRGAPVGSRYAFKHALIRDAVYGLLTQGERVAEHARIAGLLERDFPELAASEPEILAAHFTAGAMPMRAVACLEWAGRRARELGSHAEAGVHFSKALGLLASLPEGRERSRLELDLLVKAGLSLSVRNGYAAAEVEVAYDRARELCRRYGERTDLYPVLRGLSAFYLVRARLQSARELAEECVRLGKELRRLDYLIGSYDVLGYALLFAGDVAAARGVLAEGFDLCRIHDGGQYTYPTPQHPAIAYGCLLAITHWMIGDDAGASRYIKEALDKAEQLQQPFDQAYAHCFAALLETLRRDLRAVMKHARTAIELSQHHGYAIWLQAGTFHLAIAEGLLGGGLDAINLLVDGLRRWRDSGAELNRSFYLAHLAEVYRANGMLDDALATIDEAIEHAHRFQERIFEPMLLIVRGELLAISRPTDDPEAEAQLLAAIGAAGRQGTLLFELRAATSLHKLCVSRGRPEASRAALLSICERIGSGSSTDSLADLHEARAQLGKSIF